MIDNKTVLAVIPARGGSKRLPGKNLKALGGKPLIQWSIEAAMNSDYIDRIIVSSDNDTILQTAEDIRKDLPLKRAAAYARDETTTIQTLHHILDTIDERYDILIVLQPTSPLRTTEDINTALQAFVHNGKCKGCISVTPAPQATKWTYTVDSNDLMHVAPPGDDGLYQLNGAIYIHSISHFIKNHSFTYENYLAYIMPDNRSVDIDTYSDFDRCKALIAAQR